MVYVLMSFHGVFFEDSYSWDSAGLVTVIAHRFADNDLLKTRVGKNMHKCG